VAGSKIASVVHSVLDFGRHQSWLDRHSLMRVLPPHAESKGQRVESTIHPSVTNESSGPCTSTWPACGLVTGSASAIPGAIIGNTPSRNSMMTRSMARTLGELLRGDIIYSTDSFVERVDSD
jgi:hypothetical protein